MDEAEQQLATPLERLISIVEEALPLRKVADAEEREVKILGVDREKLQARIDELPNTTSFKGTVRTWQFELPEMGDSVSLRYRSKDGFPPTVDVKGPRIPHPRYKVKREINWELMENLSPEDIARRLGGTFDAVVEKRRSSYAITDGDLAFHLDVDMDPDLGLLVEIEGATDAAIERAIVLLRLEGYETSAAGRCELMRIKGEM